MDNIMKNKLFYLILLFILSIVNCSDSTNNGDIDSRSTTEITSIEIITGISTIRAIWETNEPVTGSIEYGTSSDYTNESTISSNLTTSHDMTVTGLTAGTKYYFRIKTINASEIILYSNALISRTDIAEDATPPEKITDLMVPMITPKTALTIKQESINLNLSWGQSNDDDFAEYRIYRNTSPGVTSSDNLIALITNITTISFQDLLTNNSYYFYVIYVVDQSGNYSEISNEIGVAKYPIGNIFKLVKNSTLTSQYPDPISSPEPIYFQRPIYFIFCDAKSEGNGGIGLTVKLANNFSLSEYIWSATAKGWDDPETGSFNYAVIDPLVVEHIQNIRINYGAALTINSSFRSPTHNATIGGATYSRHMYGDACDIKNPDAGTGNQHATWEEIADLATAAYHDGVGYGAPGENATYVEPYHLTGTWIHADWRYTPFYSYQNY
jgi:peptidase M15-like protein